MYGFNRSTPVLYFGLRCRPHRWRSGSRRYLLWPVYAYRVVVPQPRERQINLLQKHILGLCRSGMTDVEEIGAFLDIPDAAEQIRGDLQSMGFLDQDFMITHYGERLFKEETVDQEEMASGYVFQDPWTGRLWPRFVGRLTHADVEQRAGAPHLCLGTTGKPRSKRFFIMHPGRETICYQPKPYDILHAARKHRWQARTYKRSLRRQEHDELDDELSTITGQPPLQKVTLISEQPMPLMLATFAYIPEDVKDGAFWQVCDPFGLGPSRSFKSAIEQQIEQSEPLSKYIRGLTDKLAAEDYQADVELFKRRVARASDRVEDRLTIGIRKHQELFQRLIEMEVASLRVAAQQSGPWKGDLKDFVTKAQIVLENLFRALGERFPTVRAWQGMGLSTDEAVHNGKLISGIASAIGFAVDAEGQLPPRMVNVKLGKIKSAADYDGESINARVIAALLAAHRDPAHPLHHAARCFPDMLARIHDVAELRNRAAAHDADGVVLPKHISEVEETVYRSVETLLLDSGAEQETARQGRSTGT